MPVRVSSASASVFGCVRFCAFARFWDYDRLGWVGLGRVGAFLCRLSLGLCVVQVVLDDNEEKVYTLTAAQADEGEGTKNLKLRNVKGQGGVRLHRGSAMYACDVHAAAAAAFFCLGPWPWF